MVRSLKGWTCERPGKWISPCGEYVCFCAMVGLWCEQWEVFRTSAPHGEMIDYGLTFKEAIADYSKWKEA